MSRNHADDLGTPPGLDECAGLRERKARRTRQTIHESAVRRVFDDGLDAATVASIAEDAGISPRTFFNYFATKEDAVLSGLTAEEDAQRAAHLIERADLSDPIAALPEILREVFFIAGDGEETTRMRRAILQRHPHLLSRKILRNAAVEQVAVDAVAARLPELLDEETLSALDAADSSRSDIARVVLHIMAVPLQFTNAAHNAARQTAAQTDDGASGGSGDASAAAGGASCAAGGASGSADTEADLTDLFDRGLALLPIILKGVRA